ncbi:MAG: Maf-like protein [Alphaproteobacteria bacterium]|nr:Maf-like protein [Alphaproteobacteria bacterium]
MIDNQKLNLILASGSRSRKSLLNGAGIAFTAHPADIDESIIKTQNTKLGINPAQTAQDLADAKALYVGHIISQEKPSALVLGSDQICHLNGQILDKPGSKANLSAHLQQLTGKTHTLTSALSIVQNGKIIFRHKDAAHLTMYDLNEAEIADYIKRAGDDVIHAAGGYHLEAIGVQLFKQIEGSYFTILGLPLLPLIEFLRDHGYKNNKQRGEF